MKDYATMERDPAVLAEIRGIEALLRESGIADECAACWRGERERETGGVGCCSNCNLSNSNGCLNKPLSCALWLCEYLKKKYPTVAKKLGTITAKYHETNGFRSGLLGFRQQSLEAEQPLLFKIQL